VSAAGEWLWRRVRALAKIDDAPLQTRLTRAEALEIARRSIMGEEGELFQPGAGASLENGRVVWCVITHVGYRGGNSRVYIDDETGNVIRHADLPR
jgi:hypothetical protein